MPAIIKSGQLQVVQTKDGVVVGRDDDEGEGSYQDLPPKWR